MKGEDLQGAVGLWSFTNEEAYLADVRITPAAPQNLKNGSDVAGSWEMRYSGAPGPVNAFLAGWIDGDSGKGRMRVEGRSGGAWIAKRKD
ncbi:MAG TPA: hypothetical protein VFT38_15885 [Vicinamibacteria bacterium]|nr:hypothetical protein [Vicinamibacteria bacterium]